MIETWTSVGVFQGLPLFFTEVNYSACPSNSCTDQHLPDWQGSYLVDLFTYFNKTYGDAAHSPVRVMWLRSADADLPLGIYYGTSGGEKQAHIAQCSPFPPTDQNHNPLSYPLSHLYQYLTTMSRNCLNSAAPPPTNTPGPGSTNTPTLTPSATPVPQNCRSPWTCQDVGSPSPTGGQYFDGTSWTLWGAGNGLDTTSDSFHFAAQPLLGDGSVSARVVSQLGGSTTDKAGVMIRESLQPGAAYFHLFYLSSQGSLAVEERKSTGVTANMVAIPAGQLGTYIKVERQGNLFTAYSSPDGLTWTAVASDTIAMQHNTYGGLAVASLNSNALTTATFDHVNVGCFVHGFCGDIGSPSPTGGQYFDGTSWTLWGAGNGLDTTSDSFHFAAQPLLGDGSVSARVVSQLGGSTTDKAGVMIRESLQPGAAYFHLFYLSSQGSLAVEERKSTGVTANVVTYPAGRLGTYIKVERQGNLFTAFSSPDGQTWTAVASDTIAMQHNTYGGLAVASLNSNALTTATFSGPVVGNNSFETPALGPGNFAYDINLTGTTWTFPSGQGHGSTGISANNSGFTGANPPAPDGGQVAFVNGMDTISQTIPGWQAGPIYTLSFDAAQRGEVNSTPERFEVLLDGTVLGTYTPTGTQYQPYAVSFSTGAGPHSIAFVGQLDSQIYGDNTAFIDNVQLSQSDIVVAPSGPVVGNNSFETPALGPGNFAYDINLTGTTWTFASAQGHGSTGISANNSGFTGANPPAPDGGQVAWVNGMDTISQTIPGWQAGITYTLTFAAAQRGENNTTPERFNVMLDNQILDVYSPSGTSYQDHSVSFSTSAGSHTLAFAGLLDSQIYGDNTAFIDNVRLTQAGTFPISTATPTATSTTAPLPTNTPTQVPTVTPTSTPVSARLTLSPLAVSFQQTVTVTGTNFGPSETLYLFWDSVHSSPITTTAATAAGSFVTRFSVPQAISGTHTVIAYGQTSGKAAYAILRVQPRLIVSPSSGATGTRLVTAGFGFGKQELVAVYWDKPAQVLGSSTTSATGSFFGTTALTITVPSTATLGRHVVYGVGQTSHAVGATYVTVH